MKLSVRNEIILIFVILILGFVIRFFTYLPALRQSPTPLQTPDPHYHARRVINTVVNYPHLPVYDSYLSYPNGGYCIWPPAFDFICASVIYGVYWGKPTIKQVEWGCALFPIFLGLIVIFMVYLLTKLVIDQRTALWAAIFTAVLPSMVIWSRLGYFDHHIAESLVLITITFFLTQSNHEDKVAIIGLGLTMGLGMLMWQGVILFVGIAFLVLLLRRHYKFFWSFALNLVIILPFCIKTHFPDSPFSYRGLSMLHILLLCLACSILLGIHLLRRRSIYSYIIGIIMLGLFGFLVLSPSFVKGFAFIVKKDPWLANIIEFQPLIVQSGFWETITANRLYGRAYFLWPILLILLYMTKRNCRIFILCSLILFTGLMAFLGRRYTCWFAPFYAIILAYGFMKIWDLFEKKKNLKLVRYPLTAILAVVIFEPILKHSYENRWLSPNPEEITAYEWIRDHTPPTAYYYQPTKHPEYGIMCFWGDGHHLLYYARRPITASNFGNDVPNFNITNQFYLSESESEASSIMDSLRCHYVYLSGWQYCLRYAAIYLNRPPSTYLDFYPVLDNRGLITTVMMPTDRGYKTTISRLQYNMGNSFYLKNNYFPPYRHYRLLFIGGKNEEIKFYEYVSGAVILATTQPGKSGIIELDVRIGDVMFTYRDSLNAAENGIWKTIVPYPADAVNPYRLTINGKIHTIIVPESAIKNHDTIKVP